MTEIQRSLFLVGSDGDNFVSGDIDALVSLVITETTRNLESKPLDGDDRIEYQTACDALNSWRVRLRCAEETGSMVFGLLEAMAPVICATRGYAEDEFELAMDATRGRARIPFGTNPLATAHANALLDPIRLFNPLVSGRLPTVIASMARQLQIQVGDRPILLPIEQMRVFLGTRKLVVSGAIRRLLENGILEETGQPRIRRAREMKFVAVEGKDFETVRKRESEEEGVASSLANL